MVCNYSSDWLSGPPCEAALMLFESERKWKVKTWEAWDLG